MTKEAFFHDWLVSYLQGRLARDYKEIKANIGADKKTNSMAAIPT